MFDDVHSKKQLHFSEINDNHSPTNFMYIRMHKHYVLNNTGMKNIHLQKMS